MNFNISNLASLVFAVNHSVNAPVVQNTGVNHGQKFSPDMSNTELLTGMNREQLGNLSKQITQATTNIMSNVQQNIFLRDMLSLPKEWTSLLQEFIFSDNAQISNMLQSLITTKGNTAVNQALLELLNTNARVNLELLAAHLSKNAGLMADKLLKYMGGANMSQNNIAQLKSIMLIGASIANSANVNPNEFIRDIMQMYLPWLPLVPPNENDLNEIEMKLGEKSEKDAQVLFYVSTKNAGYFKIEIITDEHSEIFITNLTDNPNEDLKATLIDLLNNGVKKVANNSKIYFSQKFDEEKISLKDKQIFIVNSNDSMVALNLIHTIAKIIFEFDEKEAIRFIKNENA